MGTEFTPEESLWAASGAGGRLCYKQIVVGRKPFVYQERKMRGWCGPAVLSMALISLGFDVSQEKAAEAAPYDPAWGTDHAAMLRAARAFVPTAYEVSGKTLVELAELAKTNVVIVNFMDTEPIREPFHGVGNGEDGHYALLDAMDDEFVSVVDPNPVTPVDGGPRNIRRDWFERHFWDIDRGGIVVERWALVIPAAEF